jgi:hypothetical protein
MKKNMGSADKNLRMAVGIIILIVGYLNDSWWGLIGLVPLLTSFFSFCPMYLPLKFNTLKKSEKN